MKVNLHYLFILQFINSIKQNILFLTPLILYVNLDLGGNRSCVYTDICVLRTFEQYI